MSTDKLQEKARSRSCFGSHLAWGKPQDSGETVQSEHGISSVFVGCSHGKPLMSRFFINLSEMTQ